jgi:hypothetical protein
MMRQTYRDFDATELFCPRCQRAVRVRKKLLLILADGEKYDYTCLVCGTSVGDKLVRNNSDAGLIIR